MVALIRALFQHQAYADAAMLTAIERHGTASNDDQLRTLCHHILVAHRFWIHLCQGLPFDLDVENIVPASFGEIVAQFQATQQQELDWLNQLQPADLQQVVASEHLRHPVNVGEALTQVVLHSQGHRAQCATRLRLLGGEPPTTDYVHWVKEQPTPAWD